MVVQRSVQDGTQGACEYSFHTFVKSFLQKVRNFRHLWKTKWDWNWKGALKRKFHTFGLLKGNFLAFKYLSMICFNFVLSYRYFANNFGTLIWLQKNHLGVNDHLHQGKETNGLNGAFYVYNFDRIFRS